MTLCAKRPVCLIRPEAKETCRCAEGLNRQSITYWNLLPFNAAISRILPVDAPPMPLADAADGLVQHRAVRHLLKA